MKRIPFIFAIATLFLVIGIWYMVIMIKFSIAINDKQKELEKNIEIYEGSVVVLGESGSIRLATPEDIDNDTLGMIVSSTLYLRDTIILDCIDTTTIHLSDSSLTVRGLVKGINTKDID